MSSDSIALKCADVFHRLTNEIQLATEKYSELMETKGPCSEALDLLLQLRSRTQTACQGVEFLLSEEPKFQCIGRPVIEVIRLTLDRIEDQIQCFETEPATRNVQEGQDESHG